MKIRTFDECLQFVKRMQKRSAVEPIKTWIRLNGLQSDEYKLNISMFPTIKK